MQYVFVILETESDTPGIRKAFGPYHEPLARHIQELTREALSDHEGLDPKLVQVAELVQV